MCFPAADDLSRVKLLPTDEDEGSDYINANYIPVSVCNMFILYFNTTSTYKYIRKK